MDSFSQTTVTLGLVFLAIESLVAAIAGIYVTVVYRQRSEDSAYLRKLVIRDWRVAGSSAVLAVEFAYSGLRLLEPTWNLPPLPQPWGLLIGFACVGLMEWGVISDARQFQADRRFGGEAGDSARNERE